MVAEDEKTRRLNKKTCVAHALRLIGCVPWIIPKRHCQLGKHAAPAHTHTEARRRFPSFIRQLGTHAFPLSTRHSVGVRSTPVASTRWCLTKSPSFVLAFITLTTATGPITLPASAHIWASGLKHALLKKQKLVSFVRLSGILSLCSLQTHQV